jgi:hypothetical protein
LRVRRRVRSSGRPEVVFIDYVCHELRDSIHRVNVSSEEAPERIKFS